MNRMEYRHQLEKVLKDGRLEHSLGVEYTAAALAMCHGENIEKAAVAGLLHDCAKCLSKEEKMKMAQDYQLSVSAEERSNPELLHAKLGAILAKETYGIHDEELLSAIQWHTTGHPNMSLLDKIIYIADYIEPSRNQAEDLEYVRRLAFQDINQCLLTILENTVQYLDSTNKIIDPITRETYEYYNARIKRS